MCALSAFLTWCVDHKHLRFDRPRIVREAEPPGRERWLNAAEFKRFKAASPPEWWPLFAAMVFAGLRIGEAQGLRGEDLRLVRRRIRVRIRSDNSLKTIGSDRDVPVPEELAKILAVHCEEHGIRGSELVFQSPCDDYRRAWRVFGRVCRDAGIEDASPHALRHTYGVHAAISGVPVARLQKLLGHRTPYMALRYAQHAPEPFFKEDAARIAGSLGREETEEAEERANLAKAARKAG